jgi:CheY-like chemotaxis protein
MRPLQILLVEDNEIDAMAFERGMKKQGLSNKVVVVGNGVEALKILLGTHPEKMIERPYLIFLDLNMPLMGGLELLEQIRNDENIDISTVFVLTTSEYRSDVLAAYKHQVAGYIVKKSLADSSAKVHDLIQRYEELVLLPGASGHSSLEN